MEKEIDLKDKFIVGFHGSFIPLQGIEYIIRAAKMIEDKDPGLIFRILGQGQTYGEMRSLASDLRVKNLEFIERCPLEKIPDFIRQCDVCLGIFGNTDKADRVIPNKVYECAAMGKAIISADTRAIREIFTNRQDILLCRRADAEDLAEKILSLRADIEMRERIAQSVYDLFINKISSVRITEELVKKIF